MKMRRKGLLGLLALLLLFVGYLLASMPGTSRLPASYVQHGSVPGVLIAQPLKFPVLAENAPGLIKGSPMTEPQPAFLSGSLAIYHLVGEVNGNPLFPGSGNKLLDTNASLLIRIAQALGLSSLVLRE